MPDLEHTLQGHDLGFLKIVAGAWGLELNAPDAATVLPVVARGIIEHSDFAEVVEALPQDAKDVLLELLQHEGKMLWAAYVRKFGDVRRMGMARRDRERPDQKPVSPAEVLWYRGLVGRAFLSLPQDGEPQEYAYIPEDLLPLLPSLRSSTPLPLGRPASPKESAYPMPVSDRILDHTCTLLAALRLKLDQPALNELPLGGIPVEALKGLLRAARLLDHDLPHPEKTRAFLEAPRGKALAQLTQAWIDDKSFNELRLLPGLKFEGDWRNDPQRTREAILELIGQIPAHRWWSLSAFVTALHEQIPDFQRPAGDYDSWFIQQESTGNYLRGFSAWDEIDGALVRFLITGPMHWLGLLDLAAPEPGAAPAALRLSEWAAALWHGDAPDGLAKEEASLIVSPEGRISIPLLASRPVRYQIARFCAFEHEEDVSQNRPKPAGKGSRKAKQPEYHYRITPAALERAQAQGLRPAQLAGLLRRYSDKPVPPPLIKALERWENEGTQAVITPAILLRVTSPEVLSALRKTRAARCLDEEINETTVLIKPGMEGQVLSALAETGYLAEAKLQSTTGI